MCLFFFCSIKDLALGQGGAAAGVGNFNGNRAALFVQPPQALAAGGRHEAGAPPRAFGWRGLLTVYLCYG